MSFRDPVLLFLAWPFSCGIASENYDYNDRGPCRFCRNYGWPTFVSFRTVRRGLAMRAWLRGLHPVQKSVVNTKRSNRRRLSVEMLEERRLLAASITEFPVPTAIAGQPVGITSGPDGALWLTEQGATQDQIGQVSTVGAFQLFNLTTGASLPGDIVTGPDGALWFVQTGAGEAGRTDTSGQTQEFSLGKGSTPHSLTSGPGQAISIADAGLRQIREIATNGSLLLAANLPSGSPEGITIGPDGNVWFTNPADNSIETLPAGPFSAAPPFKEFPIPTPNSAPQRITVGPDGNLWFTEQGAHPSGSIEPAG